MSPMWSEGADNQRSPLTAPERFRFVFRHQAELLLLRVDAGARDQVEWGLLQLDVLVFEKSLSALAVDLILDAAIMSPVNAGLLIEFALDWADPEGPCPTHTKQILAAQEMKTFAESTDGLVTEGALGGLGKKSSCATGVWGILAEHVVGLVRLITVACLVRSIDLAGAEPKRQLVARACAANAMRLPALAGLVRACVLLWRARQQARG
jgi:hypothetical protein